MNQSEVLSKYEEFLKRATVIQETMDWDDFLLYLRSLHEVRHTFLQRLDADLGFAHACTVLASGELAVNGMDSTFPSSYGLMTLLINCMAQFNMEQARLVRKLGLSWATQPWAPDTIREMYSFLMEAEEYLRMLEEESA